MIALSDFEKEEFDLPAFSCLCYHFVCNFVHAYKFRGNFFSRPSHSHLLSRASLA